MLFSTGAPGGCPIPASNRPPASAPDKLQDPAVFKLKASNLVAEKGSEVCIEVTAEGFQQILSMQYSMSWDVKVLKFKEVRAYNLPGMSKNNFGTHLTSEGRLTFSWYDPNLRGLTKPGGFKLYEVCFEVKGERGSRCKFEFNGQPTIIEIANAAGVFMDLKAEGGVVEVK